MSHLATVKTEIRDIKALKAACDELGLTFVENQTTHHVWCADPRTWATVSAPCSHAITCPNWDLGNGVHLEVGLIKTERGYSLSFDNMLDGHNGFFTNKMKGVVIGQNGGKLMQLYGVHKATLEAKKLGYAVSRNVGQNGAIKLTVSGM